jgi:outer membrane biogenesis lipoprotein LolB
LPILKACSVTLCPSQLLKQDVVLFVQDFDQEKELQEYETAQREAELAAEAERAENFAWMQDMADAEPDLDRFRLVEILRDG